MRIPSLYIEGTRGEEGYYIPRLARVRRLGLHRYDVRWPVLQPSSGRYRDSIVYRDIKTVGDDILSASCVNETTEAA